LTGSLEIDALFIELINACFNIDLFAGASVDRKSVENDLLVSNVCQLKAVTLRGFKFQQAGQGLPDVRSTSRRLFYQAIMDPKGM